MTSSHASRYGRARYGIVATLVAAGVLACSEIGSAQISLETVHAFTGGEAGGTPRAALLQAGDGFYGVTARDGSGCFTGPGCGTVFRLLPDGTFTILHAFDGMDGTSPFAPLIEARDGNFYGTTEYGGGFGCGRFGCGTAFQMTPDGRVTTLHAFTGRTDGGVPWGALIEGTDGNFYGTASIGGSAGNGLVFRMTDDGAMTILHVFTGGTDGASPCAALILGADGNFYGTTGSGGGIGCGGAGCGAVFQMTLDGTVTILYAFAGGTDGASPRADLIQASDGNFYGTTQTGGLGCSGYGCGTIFQLTPDGAEIVVHSFDPDFEGIEPVAALLEGPDGNFYGTTEYGGGPGCRLDCGTIFQMTPDGTFTTLHVFTGGIDGRNPSAALIQGTDGNFYGTAQAGGEFEKGVVFRLRRIADRPPAQ
jgi:uncharacterized repeat protein (TIGR03803 family)